MKLWLATLVIALVIGSSVLFMSPKPHEAEAAVDPGTSLLNFTYSTATHMATWQSTIASTDTFPNLLSVTFLPAGTTLTAVTASTGPANPCGTLPATSPASCTLAAGATLTFTYTTPFSQACAATVATIGSVTYQWGINGPTGTPSVIPAATSSLVGGVSTPNSIPALTALCPTATPTPTATPVVLVPYVPTVAIPTFQNPAVGGLFNPIAKTPTPRPVVGAAPASADLGCVVPIGQGVAGVCLRPPNTGDAGLKALEDATAD